MANPNLIQSGDPNKVDTLFDSAAVGQFKRGYVRHVVAGATSDGGHQGVAIVPSEVQSFGTAANGTATATLPAVSGKVNYLTGILVTGGGASSAGLVVATVTGLLGGTLRIVVGVPSGVTTALTPILQQFASPLAASGGSVAISLTVPPFGSGNTNVTCALWGYVSA